MALNRNAESHFALAPMDLDIGRSIFDRSSGHKTTFNTGDLIPIYLDEVLPGDTFAMDMGMAVRMATPIFPVMDNLSLDIQFYFVPNRLVWEHWAEFLGENNTTAWEQQTQYTIPQIIPPDGGWREGTIADYMGIPTKIEDISISALPFRAYCKIWNDWWRDENLKQPAMINMDETTETGSNGNNYVTDAQLGGMPLKAAKWHDYFTSALPEPQKGEAVSLNLGAGVSGMFPVVTGAESHMSTFPANDMQWIGNFNATSANMYQISAEGDGTNILPYTHNGGNVSSGTVNRSQKMVPSNLYADIQSEGGGVITINELRQAFAIQRMFEKDARGGR